MNNKSKIEKRIKNCTICKLHTLCNEPVIGRGNYNANYLFVGEAPGEEEDKQGLPFVGRSGKVLDEAIVNAGIVSPSVYITNIVKCRPPKNRNPKREEICACFPVLIEQIALIKPGIIVPLGNFASKCLLPKAFDGQSITETRGRAVFSHLFDCYVLPTFHPAATLYDPKKRETFFADIKKVKEFLPQ